jgi:hypothetical protein
MKNISESQLKDWRKQRKMMNKKEAYEFIESHVLQAIYMNVGSAESMKVGKQEMKEAFRVLGITK